MGGLRAVVGLLVDQVAVVGKILACKAEQQILAYLFNFICSYVELAMETLAQNQERHPVYVEIVAASWTPAECGKKRGYDQEDYPDAEHSPHGSVGGRKMMGDQQGGDIYEHSTEKKFAASPC